MVILYTQLKSDSIDVDDSEEDIIFDKSYSRDNSHKHRNIGTIFLISLILMITVLVIILIVFYVHEISSILSPELNLSERTDTKPPTPHSILKILPSNSILKVSVNQTFKSETRKSTPGLSKTTNSKFNKKPELCKTDECLQLDRYLSESMDFSVDPCDDFYGFACGNWQYKHKIPSGKHESETFLIVYDFMHKTIKNDLEQREAHHNTDLNTAKSFKKLKTLYQGCLNTTSRSSTEYSTLKMEIDALGGWPSLDMHWTDQQYIIEDLIINSIKTNYFPIIKVEVVKDQSISNKNMIVINPLDTSHEPDIDVIQVIIKELSHTYSRNYSSDEFENDSYQVNSLFSDLSGSTSSIFQNKNTLYQVEQLKILVPQINLAKILKSLFSWIELDTDVLVGDTTYLKNLGVVLSTRNKRTVTNYFCTMFLMKFAQYLTANIDTSDELSDTCLSQTEDLFPNLLGNFYVDKYFKKNSTKYLREIVDFIQQLFIEVLNQNDWMNDSTRGKAILKVQNITKNLIQPKWPVTGQQLDQYYGQINVSLNHFLSSVLSISRVKQKNKFLQMSCESPMKLLDIWPEFGTLTINAFYDPELNGIYIPAGVAQPPFFSDTRQMVFNLGFIGYLIGHEFTHSLDKQKYSSHNQWCGMDCQDIFLQKVECFEEQYDRFNYPEFSKNINGYHTANENIADNGGIILAFKALKAYQKTRVRPFEALPGAMNNFTEEQLLFISFANNWCSNTDSSALLKWLYDAHPPGPVRVNGTLANFDQFGHTFNCKVGTKMNPKEKCILW